MKNKFLQSPSFVRFRRWSRAGYAVFRSLACSVSIGHLAVSVSDKSFLKTRNVAADTLCLVGADDTEKEENPTELSVLEFTFLNIAKIALFESKSVKTVACEPHVTYNIIYPKRLK
jgi:hypothetical protein